MVKKRYIYFFCAAFVLFAGTNCDGLFGIGSLVKIGSNIFFLLMLLDLAYWILAKRFRKISFITVSYIIYVCLYIGVSLINRNEEIKEMLLFLMKSVVGLIWMDRRVSDDSEILTGPIMYAFIVWCLLDGILTMIYPEGVPFLLNGYVLGWKNNKIMHLFGANILLAFKYLKLKENNRSTVNFRIVWLLFFLLCLLNAQIVESSTTMVVIALLFVYSFLYKIIGQTVFVNGKFVFFFHVGCFILLIFVRELFQQPLDNLMQILFQKDATFTGRIYIWRAAFVLISKSFLVGYGNYGTQQCILGDGWIYNWSTAHNQILECMMEGGIILTSIWVFMVWRVMVFNHKQQTDFSKMALFALFSFLFFFQTEAALSMISFFIFYIFYCMGKYERIIFNDRKAL